MQHPNTNSTKRRPLSKNLTNATVVHAKNALKEKKFKNSYFYKYNGNYCKQTLSKSRDGYSGKAIYKGRKRPLSPESEAASSGSGSSTLDQWRGSGKVAMGTLIPNLLTQQHILNLTGVQNFQNNFNMKYRTN